MGVGVTVVLAMSWAIPEMVTGFQASPLLQTSVSCRMGRQNVVPRMQLGHFPRGPTHAESASDGTRRAVLVETLGGMVVGIMMLPATSSADTCTRKDCQPQANFLPDGDAPQQKDIVQMPGLKGKNYGKTTYNYPDYTKTETGLQYKDVKLGTGDKPKKGDRVVFDWEGYTIGYYGRIFKAKNGVKGGAFDADTEFERFVVGSGRVLPGLEQGLVGMSVGGVRQIVVPPELGYPLEDPTHEKVGPKPPNFDGQRALNFVLYNQGLIDKTLLFNVKLLRIDKPDANGGFNRGGNRKSGQADPEDPDLEKLEEAE